MKSFPVALILTMALSACASPAPEPAAVEESSAPTESAATAEPALPAEAVRHVVVFKYSPDAQEAQIQQVTDAFRALKDRIPGIVAFEHGVNDSPEGKNLGFTHVYTLTFENAAARDAYLPHPDHQEFGRTLRSLGIHEETFVVDYNPQP